MIYTVIKDKKINLKAKGVARILQNCSNILSTIQGEVILQRGLGIDPNAIDSPLNKTQNILNIKEQFKKYEPRVKVEKITYIKDHLNGRLNPIVEVSIID